MPVSILDRIEQFVTRNGRRLDIARFRHTVHGGNAQDVVDALATFQNLDGGFGHALEADFRLPESSPIATWAGLGLLIDLDVDADASIVRRALDYLHNSYDTDAGRWLPVSAAVNGHPHAAWFHYEAEKGGTPIHQTPWNPTAALTGYLWHYGVEGPPSPAALTDRAITYLQAMADTDLEMHELRALVELAQRAPAPQAQELRSLTTAAVHRIVEKLREEWIGYGPEPLHFIDSPEHFLYAELIDCVGANLDYWIETLGDEEAWPLPYQWYRDEAAFERLRPELSAALAVHRVSVLHAFGRLEV